MGNGTIMPFLLGIWNKFTGYIIAGVTIALAIIGLYLKGRSDGKSTIKEKVATENAKQTKKALEVSHDVDVASDKSINDQLYEFTRKR